MVRSEQAFRLQQYQFRAVVLVSMAVMAIMVLLIACTNVANLMLARARARSREMAIRLAIGAGRLRLVRQLLVESLALSALGGLAGLVLATGIMRFLSGVQVSSDVPIALDLKVDARLLCFQEFARTYWPGRDPIGRRVRVDGPGGAVWEVVGVAHNAHYQAPSEPPRPYLYVPFEQRPHPRMTLIAETAGNPDALAGPLRGAVRSLDPDLPVLNLRSLAAHEARTLDNWFIFVKVLTGLGVAGLALALGGVYGLVSYAVSRRTAEIGIRVALGATPAAVVVRMVVRQGLMPALGGTAAGGAISFLLAPRLSMGVESGAAGNLTIAAVAVLLLAACVAASCLPARRVARMAPAGTLRQE